MLIRIMTAAALSLTLGLATAPAAMPARATAVTYSHLPVPCDGSRITGKCESCLITGIALMSVVLRVYFSKVRMPRSHKATRMLPCDKMYSADINNSSMVDIIPRFNSTGWLASPTACRSA